MSELAECPHPRQWTIDPKDGLVAEKCWCRDCGKTLWVKLLYPPTASIAEVSEAMSLFDAR